MTGEQRRGPVLDAIRAAEYCGISRGTLWNLLSQGKGPVSFKNGSKLAFYPADLDDWLASRIQPDPRTTSDTTDAASPASVDWPKPEPMFDLNLRIAG